MKTNKNDVLKMGAAAVVGAVLAGGITFAVMNNGDTKTVSESGAQAVTSNIWHTAVDKLPEGWERVDTNMETEPLAAARGELFLKNEGLKCTFSVQESYLDAPEFAGLNSDYLALDRIIGYGENRDAKDTIAKTVDVETSEGTIPFWATMFTVAYDIDGDGKPNNVREGRLAHAYPEAPNADGKIPFTEISYICQEDTQWSDETLNILLDHTTFNISGDPAPEVATPEEGVVVEPSPGSSEDDAQDDSEK